MPIDTEEMILVRFDLGDGGWSLHAPGTTDEEIAEGDGLLVCGEAEREPGDLHDYKTGDYIRVASSDETSESIATARRDGGAGVIDIHGRECCVVGDGEWNRPNDEDFKQARDILATR